MENKKTLSDLSLLEKFDFVIGVDEAGRGSLAGPVVAAAVILPPNFHNEKIKDSKKLTPQQREEVRQIIYENAISWSIASASVEEINKLNILRATILAMHRAIQQLKLPEGKLIIAVDGSYFIQYPGIPHICISQGDEKVLSIAAASILAKTYRDELMIELSKEYPQYHWDKNKGYWDIPHVEAIKKYGKSKLHRYFQIKALKILPFEREKNENST